MRKIVLSLAISLDGFIEGPNGEYDWCFTDQDYGLSDFLKGVDAILMGRKSFEEAIKYQGQNLWEGIKTYVVSTTITNLPTGYELINSDVVEQVRDLKQQQGKDVWLFGGASLMSLLMDENLVDEIHLAMHPIVLGSGKPLFGNVKQRITLNLINAKTYDTGLVFLTYSLT